MFSPHRSSPCGVSDGRPAGTPRPASSTPQLLLTVSRSRHPSASRASMSRMGTPHRPNPPTARMIRRRRRYLQHRPAWRTSYPCRSFSLACVLGHDSEAVRLQFCHGRRPRHSLDPQRTDSIQKDGSLHGDSGVRGGGSRDRGDVCARATSLRSMGEVDLVGARSAPSCHRRVLGAGNRDVAGQSLHPCPRPGVGCCRRVGSGVAGPDRGSRDRPAGSRPGWRRHAASWVSGHC